MPQTTFTAPRLEGTAFLADRCDRCNVAAKLTFALSAGGSLAFCGHHANRHVEEIVKLAASVTLQDGFAWRGVPLLVT